MSKDKSAQAHNPIFMVGMMLIFAGSVLAACTMQQQTKATPGMPTVTSAVTAQDASNAGDNSKDATIALVSEAFANMIRAETLHFEVKDSLPLYNVSPTEGDYVRPDKARGVIHSETGPTLEWVKWGKAYFTRNQGTTNYKLAGSPSPNGVFLDFDSLTNIESYVISATPGTGEVIDGVNTTYIEVLYDVKAFPNLVPISPKGMGRLDIWVSGETKNIYKLGFSAWTTDTPAGYIYYSRFDEPVSPPIEAPTGAVSDKTL